MEKISVTMTAGDYIIVENGVARKVSKEEFEEYEKTHEVSELVLVEDKENGKAD